MSILKPMPIRMAPPTISIWFGKRLLILPPSVAPISDSANVTVPMTIMGLIMETFRMAKLRPTAKASMLVAIERIKRAKKLRILSFLWVSGFVDS